MGTLRLPRGLVIDLITPFKGNGEIDERGLGRQMERVLPHVQALLIAGPQAGEGRNLHPSQREELLDKALAVIRNRAPILVWISQKTEEETLETLHLLRRIVEKRRYPGPVSWVDTPLYYRSNRGLYLHYKKISAISANPFILHNDPALIRSLARPLKRNNIRTSILKTLSRIETLQGLIFLGPLDRSRHYGQAVRSRNEFRIYDGEESHFLRHPSLSGVVSQGANLAPGAWQKVTTSSLHLSEENKVYPDYLQQIWEIGEYLGNVADLCRGGGAPLIKQMLLDMGIIDDARCTCQTKDIGERVSALKGLMERQGDYP